MSICTFFGHHDCPSSIMPKLREVLIDLIENQSVDVFYVGNKGAFDRLARSVLRELVQEYPKIHYAVVLEHMPGRRNSNYPDDYSDSILPEGIETVHPRFAISWRNKWMLRQSDFVITTSPTPRAVQHSSQKWHKGKRKLSLILQIVVYKILLGNIKMFYYQEYIPARKDIIMHKLDFSRKFEL